MLILPNEGALNAGERCSTARSDLCFEPLSTVCQDTAHDEPTVGDGYGRYMAESTPRQVCQSALHCCEVCGHKTGRVISTELFYTSATEGLSCVVLIIK